MALHAEFSRRPVRNYFSLREQLRLLMLVLPLGLVIVLITKFSKPETVAPFFAEAGLQTHYTQSSFADSRPSPNVDTRPALFPGVRPESLATIQDNSYFRNIEKDAWFHFLEILQQSSRERLAAQSIVVEYAQLIDQPDVYRGTAITVSGRARQIEKQTPAANHLGLQTYYRVVIQPDHGVPWPFIVYCLELPPTLAEGDHLSPPVMATGLFFKKLSYRWQDGLGTAPVILAKDVQPIDVSTGLVTDVQKQSAAFSKPSKSTIAITNSENSAPSFSAAKDPLLGKTVLKELRVDLEMLNQIEHRGRIRAEEKGVFYTILAAMNHIDELELIRIALNNLAIVHAEWEHRLNNSESEADESLAKEVLRRLDEGHYSVAPLFNEPQYHIGRLFVFDGIARRALRIEVQSEKVGASYGLDHYYEIDMFTSDSQNYPLVFCVRELPEGFPIGSSLHVPVRIAGFFFKDWLYRSRRPAEGQQSIGAATTGRAQYAPLLIGRAPVLLAFVQQGESVSQYLLAGLFVVTLAGIWGVALYVSRGDRRFSQTKLAAKFSLSAGQSLNGLNVPTAGEPMKE